MMNRDHHGILNMTSDITGPNMPESDNLIIAQARRGSHSDSGTSRGSHAGSETQPGAPSATEKSPLNPAPNETMNGSDAVPSVDGTANVEIATAI